jgi:hypothetical protein
MGVATTRFNGGILGCCSVIDHWILPQRSRASEALAIDISKWSVIELIFSAFAFYTVGFYWIGAVIDCRSITA